MVLRTNVVSSPKIFLEDPRRYKYISPSSLSDIVSVFPPLVKQVHDVVIICRVYFLISATPLLAKPDTISLDSLFSKWRLPRRSHGVLPLSKMFSFFDSFRASENHFPSL